MNNFLTENKKVNRTREKKTIETSQ